MCSKLFYFVLLFLCWHTDAKSSEEKTNSTGDVKVIKNDGTALMFADDLKQTLERYLFGICPQPFKMGLGGKRNGTAPCDLDLDQHDLSARLATLSLRAHAASRTDCLRFGTALANTLAELARTAQATSIQGKATADEKEKKRKLSKSQKLKIQAKQRTALAVKKKAAAAAAAAAAAKMQS
ncbi:uncharacterized protein LOC121725757 isoform X2 [Aricia agestis]|uniref:uncharacterized protein LOC121725757 isoform X2 n=1 Tax=Aricia agestis TaxID=91739 RepID=UPI001C209729|nr:uncharacterized protein LOC121725757 isoform X2 [Aricia agestis]